MKCALPKALRMPKCITAYKNSLAEILENPSKSSFQNLETLPFCGPSRTINPVTHVVNRYPQTADYLRYLFIQQ